MHLQIDHSHNGQRRWRCGCGVEPIVITEPVKLAVGNVIEPRADNCPGCRQTENAVTALEHFDPPNRSATGPELIADDLLQHQRVLHAKKSAAIPVQAVYFNDR